MKRSYTYTYPISQLNCYSFPLTSYKTSWYIDYPESMKAIHFCTEMGDSVLELIGLDSNAIYETGEDDVAYAIGYQHLGYKT